MTGRALLACLTLAAPLAAATGGTVPDAVFERFEYTGRDAAFATPLPPGHYRNPILAGYYPDPSICRVGEDYYLVNSSFGHFPGIPIFHSRDLVNWRQLGHVIDRPTQLKYDGLGITRGLFAPAISHHNGIFYVVCTMIDGGGNFLVTAKDPAGPWSDPEWLHFDGIDPSLFFDDDGRAWMVNNGNPPENKPLYSGHRAIWIQEFDVANRKLIGPRSIIVNGGADISKQPVWIEGPHLYKRDGWYYLCCAEGGTSTQHSQVILRSKAPTGPFVPWDQNPILTQRDLDGTVPQAVTCTGHADLVIGPDGKWWSVFLACRPYAPDRWATGRETFLLPVEWTPDGWPRILPPGERVPYVVKAPGRANPPDEPSLETARRGRLALPPLTGNFTWTDEFTDPKLSPLWIMLRAPHQPWWSLANGQLTLTPQSEFLSGKGNPAFLGRRLQHAAFEASVQVAVPAGQGTSAGLAVMQDEKHHYYCGVRRGTGGPELFVELRNGPQPAATLVTRALPADAGTLTLRLTGNGPDYHFDFALTTDAWQPLLPKAESAPVSVQAAGGGLHFTGALIGPCARIEP